MLFASLISRAFMPAIMKMVMVLAMAASMAISLVGVSFAQTGRPVSGVIAATDKPIQIAYVDESGETIGRIAGVGEPIYLNDEITTPAGASMQVLLRDQTVFSIGPNSTLVFDEFIFDPTSAEELALTASVKKGTFKFISGKISKLKPGAMTLKLPNATASVRGTSVVGRVDGDGGSDIVLLTGAVQLETSANIAPVDLVQPGWGVSIGQTGAAGAPEPFSVDDINEIIQEVEFSEGDAGEAEAGEAGEAETGEAGEAEAGDAGEAVSEEEAVESVVAAVRDAGEEVSAEEITTILQEAEGDPEAVAQAIVKVIIENQIERGEIEADTLIALEGVDGEALFSGEFDGEAFDIADFKVEDLNIEDIKIEDLGIEGFDFAEGESFVQVFSDRLDSEGLSLPNFGEASFEGGLFEPVAFEPVVFETALFSDDAYKSADISLTQTYDIEQVSQLILGNQFDAPQEVDFKLSFNDILFNAVVINEEFKDRGSFFGFDDGKSNFGDDGKEDAGGEASNQDGNQDAERGNAPEAAPINAPEAAPINAPEAAPIDAPIEFARVELDAFGELKTQTDSGASVVLDSFYDDNKFEAEDKPLPYQTFDDKGDEMASRELFEQFLESYQRESEEGTGFDAFAAFQDGEIGAEWMAFQPGPSLGNADTFGGLISSAYSGSATFADSLVIADELTSFSANAIYEIKLQYSSAAITGNLALSNMSLNGDTYYASNGETNISTNLAQTLSSANERGAEGDSNGTLDQGESIEEVRLTSVEFHDATDADDITSRVTTHLDFSVGSVVAPDGALDGTLAEITLSSEEYGCTPTCALTGQVGRAVSQVQAQ